MEVRVDPAATGLVGCEIHAHHRGVGTPYGTVVVGLDPLAVAIECGVDLRIGDAGGGGGSRARFVRVGPIREGVAGVEALDPDRVSLYLDDVCVARGGMIAADYTEQAGARVMSQAEFVVRIDLGRGSAREAIWTCDFSYEYVRINAEYRT